MMALAPVLRAFFTDRLMTQYGASPRTVASYRGTFKLAAVAIRSATSAVTAAV